MKSTVLATMVAVSLGLAVTTGVLAQDAPTTDQDKLSYGLGMMIGDRVLQNYGDINYEQLMQGMMAQHQGEETAMTLQEAQTVLQEQQQAQAAEAAAGCAEVPFQGKALAGRCTPVLFENVLRDDVAYSTLA